MVACDLRELPGADSTGIVGLREDNLGGQGKQQAGDFVDGLVAHRAVDENDAPAGEGFFEKASQFAGGAGIMSSVEIHVRARLKLFDAARPAGFGNATLDTFLGDAE